MAQKHPDLTRSEIITKFGGRLKTTVTGWMVRFADDVVAGSNNRDAIERIQTGIENHLKERGLELSETKTTLKTWRMGSKLHFLSWTFQLIKPSRVF